LLIVHVLTPFVPLSPDQYVGPEIWEEIDKQARQWARRHLEALAEKAKSTGVRARILLIDGTPARDIPRVARRTRADLVVIGTHGRTGFAKLFLGSVASQVVATSRCPVMTVRGSQSVHRR
jgi:nucleotide-binding universal stress UspA family protein